ncbi:MAG: lysostaphin resistance A-like protein [bacterium]
MDNKFHTTKSLSIVKTSIVFLVLIAIEICAINVYKVYFLQHATDQTSYLFIGIVRLIDVGVIWGLLSIWRYRFAAIGLSRSNVKKGIVHGIYWSLSFAGLVGLVGVAFFLSGKNPLSFVRAGSRLGISFGTFFIKVLIGCFLGPIVEDTVFIGIIYNSFRKKIYFPVALIISALLFAFCHDMSFFIHSIKVFSSLLGASSMNQLVVFVEQFILRFFIQFVGGVLFALSFEYSHSLLSPMIIHTSGNCALFVLTL